MKKVILIILVLVSLIGCISSIDYIDGAIKVENRMKVYIDNLSSQDIVATIEFGRDSITCGGITLIKNTTGNAIEVTFSKDSRSENGGIYGISLYATTSDSAIQKSGISAYNKRSDGIYMEFPRPRMIIKDSQSTESAFEITRESY